VSAPEPARLKRVAVMQPYFLPYAGYFRLMAAVDEFVLFDCVQFPRRGRVHRTEVPMANGAGGWLTLPLARQPREALIRDLAFAADARARLDRQLDALPWLASADGPAAAPLRALLRGPLDDVVGFLEATLTGVGALLGFQPRMRRSSSLAIDPDLRGQERVIAIARAVGATHYLNAPGGRALYTPAAFAEAGLALEFLPPYSGPHVQLLPSLVSLPPERLREDVLATLAIEPAQA
jgi:hypothetical protein